MTSFPDPPTLPRLQRWLQAISAQRGWDGATDLETWLLFTEEVGEAARAMRDRWGLFAEEGRGRGAREAQEAVAEELADLLSYLLDLANRLGVDLEEALRHKEARNQARAWKPPSPVTHPPEGPERGPQVEEARSGGAERDRALGREPGAPSGGGLGGTCAS